MTTKQDLHQIVDELPDWLLPEAARALQPLRAAQDDPVLRALMEAPEDDEPLTEEDIAAIEEGRAEMARGEWIPWEEVKARLFGSK